MAAVCCPCDGEWYPTDDSLRGRGNRAKALASHHSALARPRACRRQAAVQKFNRKRGDKGEDVLPRYLRAKRSKSAIWRSISSRAASAAERIPWMRSLNSSALDARERASSRVINSLV